MLEVIDYRSVDTGLIRPGGWVLDGGCYGFNFAWDMAKRGCRVVAVDPYPGLMPPTWHAGWDVRFERVALVSEPVETVEFVRCKEDPHASFTRLDPRGYRVAARTIPQVMAEHGIDFWEVVKLNIEGGEFPILAGWPGPIARQICVAFHDRMFPQPDGYHEKLIEHLGQWYTVVQHEATERFGRLDHWDSLFVLK